MEAVSRSIVARSTGPFKHFRIAPCRHSCLSSVAFPSRHNGACDFRKARSLHVSWDSGTNSARIQLAAGQLLLGERRPCLGQLLSECGEALPAPKQRL